MPISPFSRAARMLASVSSSIRGRPIGLPLRVPLAAALDMPARTRSRIIDRSNSATKRGVPIDLWRRYCYDGSISEGDTQDAKKKAFGRASSQLQTVGLIGIWSQHVWIA